MISLTNRDPRFYALLGPCFGNPRVEAVIGTRLWNEPDTTWFVEIRDDGTVHGFCAVRRRDADLSVDYLYLIDFTDHDTAVDLITAAVDRFGRAHHLFAATCHDLVDDDEAVGFVVTARGLRFTRPERAFAPLPAGARCQTGPTIMVLNNASPLFYPTLGPYLRRRDVADFVGTNVWDARSSPGPRTSDG